ncbi:MAG: hypothetical protein AABX39_06320 [Nanoarchaeota archaeon]
MSEWILKFHEDFFEDLDDLSKAEVLMFEKKKNKILSNPLRLKHLSGGNNCYREAITSNIRLVYYVRENEVWMLTIDKHDEAYDKYRARLIALRKMFLE